MSYANELRAANAALPSNFDLSRACECFARFLDDALDDLLDRLDLLQWQEALPRLHHAVLDVAVDGGELVRARRALDELFLRRLARELKRDEILRELVLDAAHRTADRESRDNRIRIDRFEELLLHLRMHIALLGNEEARAHLHACRTHQKSRRQAASVGDAARHDDGNPDFGDDLRHQSHRRQNADMAARLHTLDDDGASRASRSARRGRS